MPVLEESFLVVLLLDQEVAVLFVMHGGRRVHVRVEPGDVLWCRNIQALFSAQALSNRAQSVLNVSRRPSIWLQFAPIKRRRARLKTDRGSSEQIGDRLRNVGAD